MSRAIIRVVGTQPVVYARKTIDANYTIDPQDNNFILLFDSSSDLTCNIPENLTVPDGFQVIIFQQGTGKVTIIKDSAVTTLSANNEMDTRTRYSMVNIIKINTNTYIVGGDLA
ncbi:MAG: hypothetical protein ACOC22_03315 [bacterium]